MGMPGTHPLPYDPSATEASLVAEPGGWLVVLISAGGRQSVFAPRNDVGDVIGHSNLDHRPTVVGHFEEQLRAARYEPARMAPEPGALAAWWLTPGGP